METGADALSVRLVDGSEHKLEPASRVEGRTRFLVTASRTSMSTSALPVGGSSIASVASG